MGWRWILVLSACRPTAPPVGAPREAEPEPRTGWAISAPLTSDRGLVVAAHPEASRVGAAILAAGGNAVDAAVAVAVVLTLVEPQSSGLGGGAFALVAQPNGGGVEAWDGRETAPSAAGPGLFVAEGQVLPWPQAVPGGRSVGSPGLVRMLAALHQASGRLPWADLMQPTIDLAERGFPVSPRLASMVPQVPVLRRFPATEAYFFPGGQPLGVGQLLQNPALATTARALAAEGPDAFYRGELARALVATVREAAVNPGLLTEGDLAAYRPVRREPLCVPYRGLQVCGVGPPSSGGPTLLASLGLLSHFDLPALDETTRLHLTLEALRASWAERDRYLADPEQVGVPLAALLDPGGLAERARLIQPDRRADALPARELPVPAPAAPGCPDRPDTTHFVIADADGQVVSMTSTIENAFGSGLMVGGFLLNNELTDFTLNPAPVGGQVPVNAPGPCKRPLSSMSPTLVLDPSGEVQAAIGSPGGRRILSYVLRALVAHLDGRRPLHEVLAEPNWALTPTPDGGFRVEVEREPLWAGDPYPAGQLDQLRQLGHTLQEVESVNSGLHGLERTAEGWRSAVDPRREGEASAP